MEPSLAPVAHQFRDTTRLYVRALDGMGRDALLTRPGPRSNPLLWVAGHLVQQRTRLLGAFGPARQIPWDDLFGTGSIIGDLQLYPSVGELDAVWRSATDELLRRLETVNAATLGAPSPRWLRTQDGTLLGALAFAALHEAYHVGQMGFLRKWLGLDPIFDPRHSQGEEGGRRRHVPDGDRRGASLPRSPAGTRRRGEEKLQHRAPPRPGA